MSYWTESRPVRRVRAVDVDALAAAAADLLDDGGLRALTVRAAASRLAVAPASLYSRIRSVDDLYDLALDKALERDGSVQRMLAGADVDALLRAWFHHLVQHRWAGQVIAMRAPRGPHYLRLSEHLCTLLTEDGAPDPLRAAYALSNFVIGSAMTAPVSSDERQAPVDGDIAPRYAELHQQDVGDPEAVLDAGLRALRTAMTSDPRA